MASSFRLTIDRFEGALAVLLSDDEQTLILPRTGLPPEAREGDVLNVTFQVDGEATAALRARARSLQEELKARDPGGDIAL